MVGGIAEDVWIDEHTQSDGHEIGHVTVVSLLCHIGCPQPSYAYQCHAPSFEPVFSQLQAGLSGTGTAPCLVVEALWSDMWTYLRPG